MITAGEFCNREVHLAEPSESVLAAARRMREHHVGSLVVTESREGSRFPIGVITDRDIVVGPVAAGLRDLDAVRVRDVMGSPVITAVEEVGVVDVLKRMRAFGLRRLPVVDRHGALQGLIALDDLLQLFSEEMTDLAQLVSRERMREEGRIG